MIRYQIRNEYGLSDPELYAAPGEEDDPEALLEGVAMAGLVGVLRQLGDLAEFAAEIFHDLHEDVMATASRGHGLMLRLQQLEAEFPAVEKAIISQTDHSNYPHDDGVEWHANLQLKQNMITQGDMPRFILDSYEECRGPPHLFTLDKFDVAGAGASLKRYSDPSFFKTEHASNMVEMDVLIEKKPRRIKKKAMRWRKGATLESLLIANSESQTTSKDRASRKVPPRTTKLKSRHPWSPDHKTISRICREHLQELISSQQKILSRYSTRHYHVKPFGEIDNFGVLVQSSGKLELTKVVPVNEYDTVDTTSAPADGSTYLEAGDKQIRGKQYGMVHDTEKLQDCPNVLVGESNHRLQAAHEGKPILVGVSAEEDVDGCRPDDIGGDQDNFVDALNNMDSEGEADPEMSTECDPSANVEGIKLNRRKKEGEITLYAESLEVGPAIDLSPGLNSSCNGEESTCMELPFCSDSAPSAVSTTNGPHSGSHSGRQLNGVDWTNDEEAFNDEDLMDVSSSSSVVSDNGDLQTNDDAIDCQHYQEEANHCLSDDHAAVIHSSDKQTPKTSSVLDGMAINSNNYTDKVYNSVEHGQDFVQDDTSMIFSKPNDVLEDEGQDEVGFGIADDMFLHPIKSDQEEIQELKKELEESKSLVTDTSPDKFASLSDKNHVMRMNDLEMDNVAVPEEIVADTTPADLDPDEIHEHQDGIALKHSSMHNNLLYKSNDDETTEGMHPVPDGGLSTPFTKHAVEDHQTVLVEVGACPSSLNTDKEDFMHAPAMARDFSYVQELQGVVQGVSPFQDEMEAHVAETLAPSSCVLNDDTEALGVTLAPSASSLPDTRSSCVEQHASTETKDIAEGLKVVVAEESTANRFADDMVPPEEDIDSAIYTEKTEALAKNSTEEDHMHDIALQSGSPFSEGLETVEATSENLVTVHDIREHISNKSMLQTDNIPLIEMETTGEKCSDRDDIPFRSSAHFPEKSGYHEESLEEVSCNAEVLSPCTSDKDGSVSMKSNTIEKQPVDADLDLAWGMPVQESNNTNPFIDPAYMNTQMYPTPSTCYQTCFSEEQDFLSELLIQHDNIGTAPDSLWEPATPPDEAPSASEVMTEEDFRSFCHEYHEIEFLAGTEGCYKEPPSESKISDAFQASESDIPCSVSALPVKLDQEGCVHSKFGSQCAKCSSVMDIQHATPMYFSGKEDLEDETPEVDSHLQSNESFGGIRSPELDMLSNPVDLHQEQQGLCGVDSHISSTLLYQEKGEECCSLSSNAIEAKDELDIHANLVPHTSINEMVEELDVAVLVEPQLRAHALYEYDNQDIPCCSTSKKNEGKPVLVQGSEVSAFSEFDSPIVPSSITLIDETKDNPEASALRTSCRAEQESEYCSSGELDLQIAPSSLVEKIDELDDPRMHDAVVLDQEPEVVSRGLDSRIDPCSSTDENVYELDCPPSSSSVLVDLNSEDHASGDCGSQVTPSSLVKYKIVEFEAAESNNVLPEELEQEAHASPELDSQVAPCSLDGDKVGEIDGPLPCNGQVESEKKIDFSTEFDSQTAPCPSNSAVLADSTALIFTPIMPSTEETHKLYPDPTSVVPFQNDSYEDPQKPPPLPPLQWRLGRPRLGLLSTKGHMAESAKRIDPVLQASGQEMDTRLGLLDQDRSAEPVSFQAIKEDTHQSSMIDGNGQNVELGRLSTNVAITDVARTEHDLSFLEASENIEQQGHISSSAIEVEEHLDDTGVTSATRVDKHLDDTGVAHGVAFYQSNFLLPFPINEQQGPQQDILPSHTLENSEQCSHTDPAASEDDKSVDGHNAAAATVITSTTGLVSENRCYQQPQHSEPFSETLDHEAHISNTSEGVKHQSITSEAPSDTANHSAQCLLLEAGGYQESQNLQEQNVVSPEDDQLGVLLPTAESVAPQDYPRDEDNLEREKISQPSNPGPFVACPGDNSKFISGVDESTYVHAERPPVMGWTVGPQMIHPKYGISIEESQFEPSITDNHLIRKPISIKNIPRNPLVAAVAAHDRSSMRKVSELVPPTDKPKPEERNLLLEQIRNKTFNLKPVAPAKPTAMRSPARANTRNLKVAAIIEKANAIRQAVGSDDEDVDNWSDS